MDHRRLVAASLVFPIAVALAAAGFPACSRGGDAETLSGHAFGTSWSVKVVGGAWERSQELHAAIDDCLARIDAEMSTYRDDSELSRFAAAPADQWFAVSVETATVVAAALEMAERSGGAFDPTVEPLVRLWGFGRDEPGDDLPSDEAIAAARARCGYGKVSVRLDPPALRKTAAGVELDLSAIAKGFAVDAVSDLLAERGVASCFVEIGGEVRTRGQRTDGTPWRIGVEAPTETTREVYRVIEVEDLAFATSGDYRNFRRSGGRRFSHEIDPRTGRPIQNDVASVSVAAEDCMRADALATALMVLGPEAGYDDACEWNVDALFLIHDPSAPGGFREKATPGMNARLGVH